MTTRVTDLPLGTCFSARLAEPNEDGDHLEEDFKYCQLLHMPDARTPHVTMYKANCAPAGLYLIPERLEVLEVYGVGTFKTEPAAA